MKLIVCWSAKRGPLGHPCGDAHHALLEAGHEPELIYARGLTYLPDALFNRSAGRREAKRRTGSTSVPVLVTDAGEGVADSKAIIAWAKANPAPAA